MQQKTDNLALRNMEKTYSKSFLRLRPFILLLIAFTYCQNIYSQTLIKDIYNGKFGSNPTIIGEINNGFVFFASAKETGSELWFSDGTANGTKLLKDIYPGVNGSAFNTMLVNVNAVWFFVSKSPGFQWNLWRTDGTEVGTILLMNLGSIPILGNPLILMAKHASNLYFVYEDPFDGKELWKTDGTVLGTKRVKDINPISGSDPMGLTSYRQHVYFFANDGTNGNELWRSDGTDTGTKMVKDLYVGPIGSSNHPRPSLMVFKDKLYFSAQSTHDGGVELYMSDGTEKGTNLFMDINAANGASSNPALLYASSDKLYFTASDGIAGDELWMSDGTKSGTVLLKDINAGSNGSMVSGFASLGQKVVFNASTAISGNELYITDGTSIGTQMLKDINKGKLNSYASLKIMVGSKLYFSATDSLTGTELWETDGTSSGTKLQKDFNPGMASSNITSLFLFKNEFYFSISIDKDSLGKELYKYKPVALSGFNKIEKTGNLNFYPNPVARGGTLTIDTKIKGFYSVSLLTMEGKVLLNRLCDNSEVTLELPQNMNSGMFMLKIDTDSGILYKRIVVGY